MAYASEYQAITGTDSTESLSALSFDYLKKTHLEVRISNAGETLSAFKTRLSTTTIAVLSYPSQYTLDSSKVLTFATATLANGSVYQAEIKRVSDVSNAYVNFTDGSTVTEANLDDSSTQERYLIQELDDAVAKIREDGKTTTATTGNADTATALETSRTISISGDVTYASPAFDGTANVTAAGTVTQVQGQAISSSTPTEGQVWKYTGSTWTPSANTAASAITVKEEGSSLTTALASIDFVGSSVTATNSGDAVTITITDSDTTYSAASASALGLIKLEDDTAQTTAANAVTTTAARTYGLQINSSGQGVVNVPWSDTDTNTDTKWDGGATDLVAGTGRTSLGLEIGTDVQAFDTDNAVKDVAQSFTAGQSGAVVAVGIAGTDAVANMALANNFTLTMHASTGYLLSFSNWTAGQSGIIAIDHAGGALTFSTAIRFEGGVPTVGTTGTDFLAYYCENAGSGTEYVLATYFLAPSNP